MRPVTERHNKDERPTPKYRHQSTMLASCLASVYLTQFIISDKERSGSGWGARKVAVLGEGHNEPRQPVPDAPRAFGC